MNLFANIKRILETVHNRVGPRTILCGSLLLTLLAWHLTNQHVARRHQERMTFRVSQIQNRIEERMLEYEQVLRGAVGLFHVNDDVSRDDWKTYVQHSRLPRYFPGIQALGYAVPVAKEKLDSHVATVRAEGFPDYQVSPPDERDDYTAIVFIEPFDWRNRRAFGYDMYSNRVRREAMQRAVDTGLPCLSGKITLVQETDEDVQAGVLCYVPVYHDAAELNTPEQRNAAFRGWVYSAFRCNDLMHGTISHAVTDVRFRIFDNGDLTESALLYDSEMRPDFEPLEAGGGLYARVPVNLSGRHWMLEVAATPRFSGAGESSLSVWVAIGGLVIDLLLFAVITTLGRQRENAVEMANCMTKDLRASEVWNRSILETASDAILSVSADGTLVEANRAAHRLFESSTLLIGRRIDELVQSHQFVNLVEAAEGQDRESHDIAAQCCTDSGREFPCRLSVAHVDVQGRTRLTIIARDESEKIASQRRLADLNQQLIRFSHQAGIAEAATGVLHNVGNVLNGVTTSSGVIDSLLSATPVSRLAAANEILTQNRDNLADFLTNDPCGTHFPALLDQLSSALTSDREKLQDENRRLRDHIEHIREIIHAQQEEACRAPDRTAESPVRLMEQALLLTESRHAEYGIHVRTEFQDCPHVISDRHQILQVLTNLIGNAKDALRDVTGRPRVVTVTTRSREGDRVEFRVEDNGTGMTPEVLTRVREHEFGFTTKKDGHGFGLNSCRKVAIALGGELRIASDGPDCGSTFSLILPVNFEETEKSEVPTAPSPVLAVPENAV